MITENADTGKADATSDAAAEPAAGADAAAEALARATATAEEHWNRYLRTAAELENVRKRAARDMDQARKYAVERLAAELLPVLDSLEMGLEAAGSSSAEALIEGKRATLRLLTGALQKFGVEPIAPGGQAFDPQLHEAISVQPAPGVPPGGIVAVVQKGYQLNGRLLRPARVVVAAGTAADPGNGAAVTEGPGAA
jgi:molecular chaperone GrpE